MEKQSVLVTLTAPTCAGKSYLLNYIRNDRKLPCLVSTTTRPARAGEVEGVDYFFISEEESKSLEANDDFAELAVYNGIRYGVTKAEFKSKLDTGLTFLIVEPSGIDHYVKPALDVGAKHLKYFVDVDLGTRIKRFTARLAEDLSKMDKNTNLEKFVSASLIRHTAMLQIEPGWVDLVKWDRVLNGNDTPEHNLSLILADVMMLNHN